MSGNTRKETILEAADEVRRAFDKVLQQLSKTLGAPCSGFGPNATSEQNSFFSSSTPTPEQMASKLQAKQQVVDMVKGIKESCPLMSTNTPPCIVAETIQHDQWVRTAPMA